MPQLTVTAQEAAAVAALPAGTRGQLCSALLNAIELHEGLLALQLNQHSISRERAHELWLTASIWRKLLAATGVEPERQLPEQLTPEEVDRRLEK